MLCSKFFYINLDEAATKVLEKKSSVLFFSNVVTSHAILLYEELHDVMNTLIERFAPFSELPNVAGAKNSF